MIKSMEKIFESGNLETDNIVKNQHYLIKWDNNDFFSCSEDFELLTGFRAEEVNKFPFKHYSLINDGNEEFLYNTTINHFKATDREIVNNIVITTKLGRSIWFREYIGTIQTNGNYHFESLLIDITDFKEREIELNHIITEKTELNSSKDKLISIISHDLRAPFSSLLGFSEILLNENNLSENERNEYLQYIYDASKTQLEMVNNLLDWTRLQTGTIKFNPERLDIKDVVDNSVSVLTGSTIRKDITINVKGKNDLFVKADIKLVTQVITNLLSNAVKFTPPGKGIEVKIDLYKDNMVEVIVSDEGVGIDEENQSKLFKIDAKFSKVGTRGEKGCGYGLTLVKEIVEKHKGDIWFYSQKNKGSEFHFTLPRSEDKILVVEEFEDLQKPYQNLVENIFQNYSLVFSKNGFEAHNLIIDEIPAVLITYHEMPLMNGIQLVSSLRKKDISGRVLVIILADNLTNDETKIYSDMNVNFILPVNSSINDIIKIMENQLMVN